MRDTQKLIAFLLLIIFSSCTKHDIFPDKVKEENKIVINEQDGKGNSQSKIQSKMPIYSQTELIIQYKTGTPNFMKDMIRTNHGITPNAYEICRCDNKDVELWTLPNNISIEPEKDLVEGEIDGEAYGILDVDYEFIFGFDVGSPILGTTEDTDYEAYIKGSNDGVTVAILDTGIAPALTVFNEGASPTQFLYGATATAIGGQKSGWDFVNRDPNTYDDNSSLHGSIITDIIHNNLETASVAHQILPIKVADSIGNISYFNLLCGALRAFEIADVINMSFGWYGDPFGDFGNTIFENLVSTYSNVIVVTSAGNDNNNNDLMAHYPSSFPQPNIISVASYNETLYQVSDFSNYGANSVDFFAKGEEIPFYDSFVQGTSFAVPQVTIEVAKFLHGGSGDVLSPEDLKSQLAISGTAVSDDFIRYTYEDSSMGAVVEILKYTFYNKLISSD